MTNFFVRQSAAFKNDLSRSLGALIGIAQGLLCDGHLNDQEIAFLNTWLRENESISLTWPGDVIHQRVMAILQDGVVTEEERSHLMRTLQQLVGGTLEELAEATHVTELIFDEVPDLVFKDSRFCLTGEFVFAPRSTCAEAIERRGGIVSSAVNKKIQYVVVGGLGSAEWKHGSFGTKIEQAMKLKREGVPLRILHEDRWANFISSYPG
ncbi:MAG: BRCT domain-containing protein [Burkholderiales bacterium]